MIYTEIKKIETSFDIELSIDDQLVNISCDYAWDVKVTEDTGHWYGTPDQWEPENFSFDILNYDCKILDIYNPDTGESYPLEFTMSIQNRIIAKIDQYAKNIATATIKAEL